MREGRVASSRFLTNSLNCFLSAYSWNIHMLYTFRFSFELFVFWFFLHMSEMINELIHNTQTNSQLVTNIHLFYLPIYDLSQAYINFINNENTTMKQHTRTMKFSNSFRHFRLEHFNVSGIFRLKEKTR